MAMDTGKGNAKRMTEMIKNSAVAHNLGNYLDFSFNIDVWKRRTKARIEIGVTVGAVQTRDAGYH
ncbi:hypothetical protein psyc5s11_46710 [Clostridium gelidum]|uniref:Uncharacterized protein n=2 Tax=Clostridium gelidum TaxID=704125 RepID=A0ABN6J2Q5_9CLOT|nr:hypothetical protein psyc5s11_46710 [Clostridium gelidum]